MHYAKGQCTSRLAPKSVIAHALNTKNHQPLVLYSVRPLYIIYISLERRTHARAHLEKIGRVPHISSLFTSVNEAVGQLAGASRYHYRSELTE
ncbi:hypothetical protein EVAR_160_1 [Eumeta japonica]|uniref:Uncharacterized protein n=1 Tax=Eumeta variegata TaxID=151549 RepID=A0A4C1SBZ2_EUMVA|nr:hypothetical protein EVAR_160_1 [Eumeta japonica]